MKTIIGLRYISKELLRNFKWLYVFFLFSALSSALYSQSISGVVNSYSAVTSIGVLSVDVINSSNLQVGDKVLLIQMKGASITTGNNSSFGTITSQNEAGHFEFLSIASINGNTVVFSSGICQSYAVSGKVQLVQVPVYTDVTITGVLSAAPWDGTSGGVLVIEAMNSITFNANIDLKGLGFRGGQSSMGGFSCNDPNWANTNGGEKGEGIAEAPSNQNENRAPLANGGGGSNTGNPGAGGGGNGGPGGRGGNEWYGGCALNGSYGLGGYDLDYSGNKAFLGGGGGGGYRDNGLNAAPGSNGGGIAFIISPVINGNNAVIDASGADVNGNTDSEGAGGGGAGGCVYLVNQTLNSNLNVNVSGGKGGDILSTLWQTACHGPGGGGGAGAVVLSVAAIPMNLIANILGGNSGSVLHTGPACAGTPHGAQPGASGQSIFDYVLPTTSAPPSLGPDINLCPGQSQVLSLTSSYSSYTWSTGASTSSLTVSNAGIYWVDVPTGCGIIRDSIVVTQNYNVLDLGPDQVICYSTQDTLLIPAGFVQQVWNTGSTLQTIIANSSGNYWADVIDNFGCVSSDTVNVLILPLSDTSITESGCSDVGFVFNGTTIYNSGIYIDTLINTMGCDSIITLNYTSLSLPVFTIMDTSVCFGTSVDLIPSGNYAYDWQPVQGTMNPNGSLTLTADQTTIFSVIGTDSNGCESTETCTLTVYPLPILDITASLTEICEGEQIDLMISGGINYNWTGFGIINNTSANHSITLQSSETYYVSGESNYGCIDSVSLFILVNEAPDMSITPTQEICLGDNADIIATGAIYYQLGLASPGNSTSGQYIVSPTQTTTYQVIGFSNLNCTDTMETTVIVLPNPVSDFYVDPMLLTSDSPTVSIVNNSVNQITSVWNFGDSFVEENNLSMFDYTYPYSEGNYWLQLFVTSSDGCTDSSQVLIQVKGGFIYYVPNTFTPDGDEFNNVFLPVFTSGFDPANYICTIYNRWGEEVFSCTDHMEGWNGTLNYTYCPDGLYTYVIKFKNPELDEYKLVIGQVSLFR